jgi:hypothetical protein
MSGREPITIPFSTEALKANLLRLQNEWETVQASHDRDAIYWYLAAVFELVIWWDQERKAVNRARRRRNCEGILRPESQNRCRCDPLHGRSRPGR